MVMRCGTFYLLVIALGVVLAACTPSGSDPIGDFLGVDSNTGGAGLAFSPETLAFSSVVLGQSSTASTVTVTAQTAVTITAVTLVDSNYSLVSTDCVKALAKNATCTLSVKFNPVHEGVTSSSIAFAFTVSSTSASKTLSFGMSGTGATDDSTPGNVVVAFSPQSVDFSNVTVGSESAIQTVKLYADYTQDIFINTINVNNQNYSIVAEDCPDSATALAKGAFCSIQVKFAPLSAGTLGSSLKITYGLAAGQSNLTASLALSGTGVGQLSFDGLESFSATTTTTTTLNWTDISGASFYLISRINSGTATLVATQAAPASSYGITGLTPSTSYTYRVNAINSASDSDGNTNDLAVTTDTQGSFTAVADLAIAEGSTGSTPAFSCTDSGGNSPSYTLVTQSDSDSNCAINSGKVTCTAVNYKTGHSAWASNLTVRCDLNGSSFTNAFAVNVSDTNRAPSLTAIGNQTIIAGAAITGIDADDGGDDADVDLDTLLYSCTYGNDQGTAAGTACASLPNSSYSFNTGTGALAWTSSTAAAVGNATTVYTFTITASDQQGAPLTDTETFTVTVSPAVALASKPDLIPVNSSALVPGAAMTQINYDNTIAGNDTSVTYTCHFDTTIDGSVTATTGNECDDDLDTYGTASFNTSTGVFDWTPASSTNGMFEFYVTAAIGSATANDLFVVLVQEQYTLTNMLSDLDARYATGSAAQSGSGDWEDLSTNNFDGNQTNGTWSGAGTAANAYQLEFNGTTSSMDMGTVLNGETKTMISTWINSDDITQKNKVILSTGADTGNGIMVTQSPTTNGGLRLYTGSANYQALMTSLGPVAHWKLNEASGNIADSVGGATGTANGAPTYSQTGVLFDGETAIHFDGTNDYFQGSDAGFPSGGTARTLAAWVKADAIGQGLVFGYGTAVQYQAIGLFLTSGGDFIFFGWSDDVTQGSYTTGVWYHFVGTHDGTNSQIYVNGAALGAPSSLPNWNTVLSGTFRIGRHLIGTSSVNGTIDDVALFDKVLTASQVQELYQAGVGCETTTAISNNQWNMLGVIFDGTTASLQLNGRAQCSYSAEGTFAASTNLTVGATSAGANYWDGSTADVKVYSQGSATKDTTNFVTTADRFREIPASGIVTSSLVAAFDASNYIQGLRFGGTGCGASSLTWNALTNALNGTLTSYASCGATTGWNGDGSAGDPYRLALNGSDDYVDIGNESTLSFERTQAFSISAWVRTTSNGPASIFSKWDGGTPRGYEFYYCGNTTTGCEAGGLKAHFINTYPGNRLVSHSTGVAINDGVWHHVTYTYAGNSLPAGQKFYVDGTAATVVNDNNTLSATVLNATSAKIGLGISSTYFAGDIAYLSVYNTELTSSQITQNCNALKARYSGATCN